MPSRRRMCLLALLGLLGFATASLPGCGGNGNNRKLLSHASASKLQSSLNDVEQRVNEGDCAGARSQASTLQQQVDGLPRRTNRKLRRALSAGTSRLVSLVDGECQPATTTTDTTPTVAPTTTETTPQNEPPGQKKKDKTKPQDQGKGKQKGNEQGDGTQTTPGTGTGTTPGTGTGGQGN